METLPWLQRMRWSLVATGEHVLQEAVNAQALPCYYAADIQNGQQRSVTMQQISTQLNDMLIVPQNIAYCSFLHSVCNNYS